jgi:hypothetical protein
MNASVSGFSDSSELVRPLDEEQARLVEILEAAGGEPVSFEQFRAQGIENPAMLAYELEIAGLAIAHVHRPRPGGSPVHVGLRLDRPSPQGPSAERRTERSQGGARAAAASMLAAACRLRDRLPRPSRPAGQGSSSPVRPAWLRDARPALLGFGAVALIGSAVAIAAALAPSQKPGARDLGSASSAPDSASRAPASGASSRAGRHRGAGTAPRKAAGAHKPAAATVPVGRAEELQAAGHRLLEEGRYTVAISELRSSLRAGGQTVEACAEPTTASCMTYAFALYDLGRALQLDNAPAAASAVLRERLRIDNQRALVEKQLLLTHRPRQAASTPTRKHASSQHKARHRSSPPQTAPSKKPPPPRSHPKTGGVEAPAASARTPPRAGGSVGAGPA